MQFSLRCLEGKAVFTAVWLATGMFATENRGDLRLQFLVLSVRQAKGVIVGPNQVFVTGVQRGRSALWAFFRWALLNGGEQNGGYATFVWQERAQTHATQMTHMPSLKPVCLLSENQGSLRHRRVICLPQLKNVPPNLGPPPFKSA